MLLNIFKLRWLWSSGLLKVKQVRTYLIKPFIKAFGGMGLLVGTWNIAKIEALTNPINELSVTEVNKWEKIYYFLYEFNPLTWLNYLGKWLAYWFQLPLNIVIYSIMVLTLLLILWIIWQIKKKITNTILQTDPAKLELGNKLLQLNNVVYEEKKRMDNEKNLLENELKELKNENKEKMDLITSLRNEVNSYEKKEKRREYDKKRRIKVEAEKNKKQEPKRNQTKQKRKGN